MKETTKNYICIGALGAIIGFLGGILTAEYFFQPVNAYIKNISRSEKKEIIMKTRDNTTKILVEQENGVYLNLDDYMELRKRAINSGKKLEIKALEGEKKAIQLGASDY